LRRQALSLTQPVHPDRQRTLGGDGRVLEPQGAGGRVSGIGRGLLAFRDQALVELVEAAEREIHLAAHLEQRWWGLALGKLHPHRDRLDRAEVRRHVLPEPAIAPRRTAHKDPVLVDEVDREAVDLRLGHVGDVARA
jgi:hypothetical protein